MRTTQDGNDKLCGRCAATKPITEFPTVSPKARSYKKFKNGIKPWCKDCYKEYTNQYMRNARKETSKYRDSHYMKKYGLTREEVIDMHEVRNHKCDICGNDSDHRYETLCVDHCHTSGKVRGLLCFSCNTLLGNAKDNVEVLKNAIIYLEKNQ